MTDSTPTPDPTPEPTETGFSEAQIEQPGFIQDKLNLLLTEKGDETIRRVLSSYEIGKKLHQLRMRKKIALVDLGKHTGLSASMLSQLENGKLVPTLPTLARIAMVFNVGIDHFFGDRKRRKTFLVVRGPERIRFPDRPDNPSPTYFFECLAFSMQEKSLHAYLAEFPKRGPEELTEHFHDGAEFVHVLEGSLSIRYDDEDHVMRAGDSVYFDPSAPHSYQGLSKPPAKAIVITTPPRL